MEISPEERLAMLEQKCNVIITELSRQSGEFQAFDAVLYSILMFVGNVPKLREQIELELEKRAASNLAESLNQDRFDGFETAANLVRLALASAEERNKAQKDQNKDDLGA